MTTPYDAMNQWAHTLTHTLHLNTPAAHNAPLAELLDLTREVAHNVARPAGPVTTYYVGLAVGLAGGDVDKAREIITELRDLIPTQEVND